MSALSIALAKITRKEGSSGVAIEGDVSCTQKYRGGESCFQSLSCSIFKDPSEVVADAGLAVMDWFDDSKALDIVSKIQRNDPDMKPVRQIVGRFATNLINPDSGYNLDQVGELYDKYGASGILENVVNDKIMYGPSGDKYDSDPLDELHRAYYDLPARKPSDAWNKDGNKEWSLNPKSKIDDARSLADELNSKLNLKNDAPAVQYARTRALGGFSAHKRGNKFENER